MATTRSNSVSNATIVIDGETFVGVVKEFSAPEIKMATQEVGGMGMFGKTTVITGLEQLEGGSITWNSFHPEIISKFGLINQSVDVQIRANSVEKDGATTTEKPLVIHLRVSSMGIPGGNYKQSESAEFQSSFSTDYIRTNYDGVDHLEVDVPGNVYIIDGVDQLAQFKANLGI